MTEPVRRALVSVYDKDGVVELCRGLQEAGIEILSSGGTARLLSEEGIAVRAVSDYTGFPEMLDGRVKTLHPRVHGGILAVRDNPEHMRALEAEGGRPIDLVVVNLYPFEQTVARREATRADIVEMIDIGGPAMVRSAAKNAASVGVVVSPADYPTVLTEIREGGGLTEGTRRRLAASAFRHTSRYDAAIAEFLAQDLESEGTASFPETLTPSFVKIQDLRYGENPHQRAAFYRDPSDFHPATIAGATQLQGKELSFNNILDFDAALGVVLDLEAPACAVIKHGNPCGVATATGPGNAFADALTCDPTSAFGGVIAFNRAVDADAARRIAEQFYEGVVAPGFDDEARAVLAKKKKLRLLSYTPAANPPRGRDLRRVAGGLLVQDRDLLGETEAQGAVVTRRAPTEEELRSIRFAWTVCKHVKSNAIVYTHGARTVGIGAGQMSRIDSARIAIEKARSSLTGATMASDAFFPFRDGIDVAAEAGIRSVVQPGGSIRDDEVIAAADEHGIAMVFTGTRHFRH